MKGMGVLFSFNILGLKDIKNRKDVGGGRQSRREKETEKEGVKRMKKRNVFKKQKQNK